MEDREKIAYLHELAGSHFNDGNLAAALSAWEQVLAVDKSNVEAQKGIALAKRKLAVAHDIARHEASVSDDDPLGAGPSLGGGGPFDSDATMVFSAGAPPMAAPSFNPDATITFNPAALPALPLAAADEDRTMVFNAATMGAPGPAAPAADEDRTMLFTPGPVAPRPAAPQPSFDADKTIVFNAAQPPQAPAPSFDAERTIMLNPAAAAAPPVKAAEDEDKTIVFSATPQAWGAPAPAPAAPPPTAPSAWGIPSASSAPPADSDATMLSADLSGLPTMPPPPGADAESAGDRTYVSADGGGLDFGVPPPPPAAPSAAPKPVGASRDLEDFVLPVGGLEMGAPGAPPALATPSMAPASGSGKPGEAPGGWGFSFELPPPPAAASPAPATPPLGLPALPSLGIPSPPPAPPRPPRAQSAKFGEVNPGEIESLSVPVVTPGPEGAPTDDKDKRQREDELKDRYAREFGRTPVASSTPAAMPATRAPATNWTRLIAIAGVSVVVVGVAAWFAIQVLAPPPPPVVTQEKPKVVEKLLTPEEAEARIGALQREAEAFMQQGEMEKAGKVLQDARDVATKAGVASTSLDRWNGLYDEEVKFQKRLQAAVVNFCREDYSRQTLQQFQELQVQRPNDPRAAKFIVSLYFNAGVQELQSKRPWEAVWYFEQVLARSPGEAEAGRLRQYAAQFSDGSDVGEEYLSTVDRLGYRRTGCEK